MFSIGFLLLVLQSIINILSFAKVGTVLVIHHLPHDRFLNVCFCLCSSHEWVELCWRICHIPPFTNHNLETSELKCDDSCWAVCLWRCQDIVIQINKTTPTQFEWSRLAETLNEKLLKNNNKGCFFKLIVAYLVISHTCGYNAMLELRVFNGSLNHM